MAWGRRYQELQWSDQEIAVRAKAPKEQPELDNVHMKQSMSSIDRR